MNRRHLYLADDLYQAARCVESARLLGLANEQISLVCGPDTPLDALPLGKERPHLIDFSMGRHIASLGRVGLLFGLIGAHVPGLNITVAGCALPFCAGALLGSWSQVLLGSWVEARRRQNIENEVRGGCVLLMLEEDARSLACVDHHLCAEGARQVEAEIPSAAT